MNIVTVSGNKLAKLDQNCQRLRCSQDSAECLLLIRWEVSISRRFTTVIVCGQDLTKHQPRTGK